MACPKRFSGGGYGYFDHCVKKAKEKESKAGVSFDFMLAEILRGKIESAPFGFAFDRGCFHSFTSKNDRGKFAQNVAAHLEKEGLWLTSVGNADEHRQGPYPLNGRLQISSWQWGLISKYFR